MYMVLPFEWALGCMLDGIPKALSCAPLLGKPVFERLMGGPQFSPW